MLKRLLLATALCAASAHAQQSTDISGADFSSGKGDAALAKLGKQAATSDKRLVITAPPEWHAAIAAKIRAGGGADVVLRDGFYENVLVRIESKPEAVKPEPEKAAPRIEPKTVAANPVAAVRTPEPKAPAPIIVPPPAAVVAPPSPPPPVVVATAPAPPAPPPPKAAKAPPPPDIDAIRARMLQSLTGARAAEGTVQVSALQPGDVIYVDEPVRGVVHRDGLRPTLLWLEGDLDLRRTELKLLAPNRYQVLGQIRGENGTLRREFDSGLKSLDARVPADNAPSRTDLERKFNDGHRIDETLGTDKLKSGDIIYSGGGSAVVVRRVGSDLRRFWLDGSLDLRQPGLQNDGANKVRVIADTVR